MAWEKGAGLADLKGIDPMDRRIEIEKRDRYARELREQISSRSNTPQRKGSSRPPEDADWIGSAAPSTGPSSPQLTPPPTMPNVQNGLASAGASMMGAPPRSPFCGSSASLDPGKAESWGTAGKVSQLQAMIHDRLRYLEEQQRQFWESLQAMLAGQSQAEAKSADAARSAAEEAVHRQSNILKEEVNRVAHDAAREAARVAQDAASAVARDTALQVAQDAAAAAGRDAAAAARDVAEAAARDAAAHIAREAAGAAAREAAMDAVRSEASSIRSAQDSALAQAKDEMRAAMSSEMEQLRNQLQSQAGELAKAKSRDEGLQQVNQDLSKIWKELERLERVKADREEMLAKFQSQAEALDELRRGQDELRQVIDRDLERMIRRAVHEELGRAKPKEEPPPPRPEPVSPPPEPSKAFKAAPKESYVILKGAADESAYYLCSLQNVIGRAAACDAVISHSQSISNQHAAIDVGTSGAVLRDLGSRNGTWLNERRVGNNEGLKLESGDAIQLGVDGPTYLFEWGPAASKFAPREIERVRGGHSSSGGASASRSASRGRR